MAHIVLLHPQCVRVGGAIQMALQSAQALQKQWHTVTLYTFEKSDTCFPDLQKGLDIRVWQTGRNTWFLPLRKLIVLATLAWELRHVDIIIANNPPMQIVAAIAKIFIGRIKTIWWHHHIPWYLIEEKKTKDKVQGDGFLSARNNPLLWTLYSVLCTQGLKGWLERTFIVPNIDVMVATSYFIAGKIEEYCGREATVIHPILSTEYQVWSSKIDTETSPHLNTENLIPHTAPITLFTHGRIEAGKGLDMLVRIFERIKREERKEKKEGSVSVIANEVKQSIELNHGSPRNSGEFLAMTGDQTDVIKPNLNTQYLIPDTQVRLIIFWTGSLEGELRKKWIDVRPFDREKTFTELKTGEYGHALGVYCSEIDGFGMAPLECQMTGISTVILDRAGARETIVANMSDEPVWYLVDSEEQLFSTISYYIKEKIFPKDMSNVNFYHQRDHFTPERLSRDLLSIINRTGA